MSDLYAEVAALLSGSERWTTLAEQMDRTATALGEQSTAALPPSVQGAGQTFLDSWTRSASESAEIGRGFSEALTVIAQTFGRVDERSAEMIRTLDGRLGPAR